MVGLGGHTSKIGTVKRRVVHTDDCQLSPSCLDKDALVHQQCDFVTIGEFGVVRHWDAAIVIVVAQCDKDRRGFPQAREKSKKVGQPFGHIEQIARDENPIGPDLTDPVDDPVMAWVIDVKMQIGQMDRAMTGQGTMHMGVPSHLIVG